MVTEHRAQKAKYCSFACYVKYTKGYDHKALGYRHSPEMRAHLSESRTGVPITEVQREAYILREANLTDEQREIRQRVLNEGALIREFPMREESRRRLSESRTGKGYGGAQNYRGGATGDAFAAVLCPQGYIREHEWQYGNRCRDRFLLDFAHPEAKVCIELDGPGHYHTPQEDAERDAILKHFGWRVIRIKHD
jgi:hypothetical protein